jgi:hypothetical protein
MIRYQASIPAEFMPEGRYLIDLEVISLSNDKPFHLADYYQPLPSLTIGTFGFLNAAVHYKVNEEYSIDYALMQEGKQLPDFPDRLGGIYTNGFCRDELIGLEDLEVQTWEPKNGPAATLEIHLESENNESLGLLSLVDAGTGIKGNMLNPYFPGQSVVLENHTMEKRYRLDQISNDLLALFGREPGEHQLRFFLRMRLGSETRRLPESGFFETTFTIADAPIGADCQAVLLPIELLDFLLLGQENQVYLKWISALEINNQFYKVERSKDVIRWETIYEVKGQGNAAGYLSYEFTDKYPYPGISYYRLRQMDFDGSETFSKVKTVRISDSDIILYPNPVSDHLFYRIEETDLNYHIEIYDLAGSCVLKTIIPDPVSPYHRISLGHLPRGTYLIKYIHSKNYLSRTARFIKL